MSEFYNIDDIKAILKEIGYEWDGKIYDSKNNKYIDFSSEYLQDHSCGISVKRNDDNKELLKLLEITDISFCIISHVDGKNYPEINFEVEKDLTDQWIKRLLQKNGSEYANFVKDEMEEAINDLDQEIDDINEELSYGRYNLTKTEKSELNKAKLNNRKEINKCNKYIKLADYVLNAPLGKQPE